METYHEDNMTHIRVIKSKHQMENSCFVRELRKMKYTVKISTDSNQQLKTQASVCCNSIMLLKVIL